MVNLLPTFLLIISMSLIIGSHFFLVLPRLFVLRMSFAFELWWRGATWLGLAILLVYVGGIMILFTYFLTLTGSQPIQWKYTLLLLPVLSVDPKIHLIMIQSRPYELINSFIYPVFAFAALWLFYAIVVVVKVTFVRGAPLRVYV